MMKYLTLLLLFFTLSYGTKMGTIRSGGADAHVAKVSADSSLQVTILPTDTLNVLIKDSSVVKVADSLVVVVADSVRIKDTLKTYIVDNNNVLSLDDATGAMNSITYEHHEIHSGSHYFICGYTTLANDATLDFQLTTADTTKWIHMTFQLEGTQQITIQIYEDANVDADGTPVTAYNNE